MADPVTLTVQSAARLARAGLFGRDQLIGLEERTGAAIYAYDRTVIVRPRGPRPPGLEPYRHTSRTEKI